MTPLKNNPSLPLWRIDAANTRESAVRDTARAADQLGNQDGKVSLSELDAFAKTPDANKYYVGYVRDDLTHPHSLAHDLFVRTFAEPVNVFLGKVLYGVDISKTP